jgi:hypothetical protein
MADVARTTHPDHLLRANPNNKVTVGEQDNQKVKMT